MRIVLLSDTHDKHARIAVPDGDVLVHAGDATGKGSVEQLERFAAFFVALPHAHKIVIAGNHDFGLEQHPGLGAELFGAAYLCDAEANVGGLRVWGAPWQPWFFDWAFNLRRGEPLREKWALVPEGIDILVTHGPPHGILDRTLRGEPVGCEELTAALPRIRPRLHVFGHIHEAYGTHHDGTTLFVNASNCTLAYQPDNPPVVVELDLDRSRPAELVAARTV
jgi:predicted phosphodiesterase